MRRGFCLFEWCSNQETSNLVWLKTAYARLLDSVEVAKIKQAKQKYDKCDLSPQSPCIFHNNFTAQLHITILEPGTAFSIW